MTFPQTYEKGSDTRLVSSVDDAVQAKFDGFRLVEGSVEPTPDPVSGPTYRELQAEAKELDVPAVGQYDDLAAAVTQARAAKVEADERAKADEAGRQLEIDAQTEVPA